MGPRIGTRLGAYEIESLLGSGGMGEVYRARDTRLGRDVALKVLPDLFAHDPDRLARFRREAHVLASLNHPNIAAIYGLEEADPSTGSGQAGVRALVLELVEGPTLADRIAQGPIPLDEALPIARQVADALEAAHEHSIIHRDLKPANIKLRPDGVVKVLDFGLAKVREAQRTVASLSGSPTMMTASMPGMILGTAAYMSPEQAKGKDADRTADVWAFGCVLYEMLTGHAVFEGETVGEVIGGVLKAEPDWRRLPAETPEGIRRLLRRCLQKERKQRLQYIGDARIEIEEVQSEATKSRATTPVAALPKNRKRLAWAAAVTLLLLVAAVSVRFATLHVRERVPDTRPIRFTVPTPENAVMLGTPPAISPDGRRVAFIATFEGKRQLWVRSLESVTARQLAGTDGADSPFWSSDSRFIAFFGEGKLKKIDASGGSPQTICDAPFGQGGAWNRDGVIVFTPAIPGPLHRVSSSGGVSTPITTIDPASGDINHLGPSFLPDGRHFLFFVAGGEKQGIYVGSLDSKERRVLLNAASAGAYASPGYVLFVKERSLMAQRLDVKNLQQAGEAFPIAEGVEIFPSVNLGTFSVSENGVLVYGTGGYGTRSFRRQLAWFDRTGKLIRQIGPPMTLFDVVLAPDQNRAAIEGPDGDIWVVDLVRGLPSRLTFHTAHEDFPVWSPDGSRIVFGSTRAEGVRDIYQKVSSGAGNEEVLLKSNTSKYPTDWSRDGRFIIYENDDPKTRSDIWVLPLFGDRKPQLFLQTPFTEAHARFSPDANWIAYVSDESGRPEVYVQSFPPSGRKSQVSTNGGVIPHWRRDGRELFYLALNSRMMSVDVKASPATVEIGLPKVLFEAPVDEASIRATNRYDVSADGQRFLTNVAAENTSSASLTVVVNWLADIKNER